MLRMPTESTYTNTNTKCKGSSKPKYKNKFYIATLNTRSLKTQESLLELEQALENICWDIIGLSEVRKSGEKIEEHQEYILYYKNETPGLYGVGFMVKKYLKSTILEFKGISDRIAVLNIKLPGYKDITSIVQVYAPTEIAKDDVKNVFYESLKKTTEILDNNVIVIGDFNGQTGKRRKNEDKTLGLYTTGKRNDNGQRMISYAMENNFSIMNSYYKKKPDRKWTWESPNGLVKNEIDYIITNKPRQFSNVEVLNHFNYNTDHRLLRGHLYINEPKKSRKHIQNTNQQLQLPFPNVILETLNNNLKPIIQLSGVQEKYDFLETELKEAENKLKTTKTPKDRIGSKAKELIKLRAILYKNRNSNKQIIVKLSKDIKIHIRKHRQKLRNDTINFHIENSGGVKKAWKELNESSSWISNMKNRKNKKLKTKRNDILKVATDFYRQLYSDETSKTSNPLSISTIKKYDEESIPSIMEEEVVKAIRSLKKRKAPGEDGISNEILVGASRSIVNSITYLFNEILTTEYIPHQWTKSTIILLHKKGKPEDITNYRPISLMSNVYKMFSKILLERMTIPLDENQPKEQAGFRSDFSTIDHIHTIKQVIQKCNEYGITYYLAFVDYSKAFDSLKHSKIWEALASQGINNKYIRIISNIYENMTARVRTERLGKYFPIKRGVRQGDPLSPKLFSATLEHVFRHLDWSSYGINVNGVLLNHLRFADDLVLISEQPDSLQDMLKQLVYVSEKVGLLMNTEKTKVMTNCVKIPIKANNIVIDYVDEYMYLGQIISPTDLSTKEVDNRISIAWRRYWSLKEVMKNPGIPLKAKRKIFNSCILPSLIYGCQTWSLTNANLKKLQTCQYSMERSMLNLKIKDKVQLKTIRKQTKVSDVKCCIKKLKWKWAGHLIRNRKDKWTKDVTEWCPRQNKRRRGRQRRRWEDDIKTVAGSTWMRATHDRIAWRILGEAYAEKQDD